MFLFILSKTFDTDHGMHGFLLCYTENHVKKLLKASPRAMICTTLASIYEQYCMHNSV